MVGNAVSDGRDPDARAGLGLVTFWRLVIVAGFLALWQWLPAIAVLHRHISLLDPYLISSPSRVGREIFDLASGDRHTAVVWPYLGTTLLASLAGTAAGAIGGLVAALWLSNAETLSRIANPFFQAINATPRIAMIPVIVIIAGPTPTASAVTAVTIVFFVVFFNAYEGARSIPAETLQNARLLGAPPISTIWRVRFPYAAAWTFASRAFRT